MHLEEKMQGACVSLEMCVHALAENQDLLHKATSWLASDAALAAEKAFAMAHNGDRTTR